MMTDAKTCGAALLLTLTAGGAAAAADQPLFDPDWNQQALYTGWRATDLLGLDAIGGNGALVGRVDDLLISYTGTLETVVVQEAVAVASDQGRTQFGVSWDSVDVAEDGRSVEVPVIRETIGALEIEDPIRRDAGAVELASSSLAEWSVETLLDTSVHMDGDTPWGTVEDLIFGHDDAVEGVVVAAEDGNLHGVPWKAVVIEPDAQALSVPLTQDVAEALPTFDFGQMAEGMLADQ